MEKVVVTKSAQNRTNLIMVCVCHDADFDYLSRRMELLFPLEEGSVLCVCVLLHFVPFLVWTNENKKA